MRGGVAFESARFWVFDRQGELCRNCQSIIDHMTAGGRRLYTCPECQQPSET
jgi:formamidopyrimidine-DNA glycosylase